MRVLVTGAFGNIGPWAVHELLRKGHGVTCLDVRDKRTLKASRSLGSGPRLVFGDIRDRAVVDEAIAGCDAVVHLAAVLPPRSEEEPGLARSVTVGGTRNLIEACRAASAPPRLIYVSSVALFGPTQHLEPPRRASDPVHVTDHYTAHKAECEDLVRESGLMWAILRLGASPPVSTLSSGAFGRINPMMFDVPLTDRIEFVHPADAGLAFANAVDSSDVWGKTLLIGGGPRCQTVQGEFLNTVLGAVGIGPLPAAAFATAPFHTDWLDTSESEELLRYQTHTLDDFVRDVVRSVGWRAALIPPMRPLIRRAMLRRSAYWPGNRKRVARV